MKIEKIAIDKIDLWEKNPRNIKTVDFERLKKQIKELGVYKPLVAVKEKNRYIVLGGDMRLRALRELGIEEIEISIVDAKTETEKIKYALSDNDRAGQYEEDKLAELIYPHIDEIALEDFKVDISEPWIDLKQIVERFGPDDQDIAFIDETELLNVFSVQIKCFSQEETDDVMRRLKITKRSIRYKDFIECQKE